MSSFILVVDDDKDIRDTLCELLEEEGYRAVGASNGKEALDLLRSAGPPCLILLDVMMPIMDGATFRAQQLNDPILSAIPIAIITAGGAQAAEGMRADAVLLKPLRIDKVLEVIERFCPSGGSGSPPI
jgi:CheY-like chemotaxis protein